MIVGDIGIISKKTMEIKMLFGKCILILQKTKQEFWKVSNLKYIINLDYLRQLSFPNMYIFFKNQKQTKKGADNDKARCWML